MIHITETIRWKFWEDKLAEEEYKRSFCDNGERISHKERKANYLSSLKGWDKKELLKLKSKQLTVIKFK